MGKFFLKFVFLSLFVGPVLAIALLGALGSIMPPILLFLGLLAVGLVAAALVVFIIYVSVKGFSTLLDGAGTGSLPRSVAQSVGESRRYAGLIMQTAQQYPPGPTRDRLNASIKPVEEWLTNLTKLEQGLAKLYGQRNVNRDLRQTLAEIETLHRQTLNAPEAEAVYLRQLIASKKQHLATLKELQSFQNQAELKIRKIASDLATTHAEMQLLTAKGDFNDNRFRRLDENLQEHLAGVRDMLTAMDELGYTTAAVIR